MQQLFTLYDQFWAHFPSQYHALVSLGILIILVGTLFNLVKKNLVWILLLVLLVPASIPILNSIWQGLIEILKYLLGVK